MTNPWSLGRKKTASWKRNVQHYGNVYTSQESFYMSESFSDRLRKIRELRGWSQLDLANKTGLQPTAISHFETGARSPSFDNLRRLSDALNVSTDYLMGRTEEASLAGPQAESLFRGLEKLSSQDIDMLKMMKEAMLKKQEGGA